MNTLMQLISDAEKAKNNLRMSKSVLSQISIIAGQTSCTKCKKSMETVLKLIHSLQINDSEAVYFNIADSLNSFLGGIQDKIILDVGCDTAGALINAISNRYHPAEVWGINPAANTTEFSRNCKIVKSDIRCAPFPDNYFDCIVSISAFEHIQDLKIALGEMFRVLKPGGILYSHFGPIWSSSYGHHLACVHNDKIYSYWNTFLPPFCHLLMTPKELLQFCKNIYSENVAAKIVEYIFQTHDKNRLLFNDYQQLIANSSFETLFFTGYTSTVLSHLYTPSNWPQILYELHKKFPNINFRYDGIELLLKKQ